jgi:exopolysaccharide biosynthesis polyprenyl glycosylphosphotransferase
VITSIQSKHSLLRHIMRSRACLVADPPAVVAENSDRVVKSWWRLTQPSSLLLYPGLRFLDFICGPLVLAAVLMAGNSQRMPGGLASFLSIRITVKNLVLLGVFVIGWWLVFAAGNLYHNSKLRSIRADFAAVFQGCSLGTLMVVVFSATSISGAFGFSEVIRFWILSVLLLCASRVTARVFGNVLAASSNQVRRCVIVGSGSRALKLYEWLLESSMSKYDVIGFIDTPEMGILPSPIRGKMIGSLADLRETLKNHVVDEVLIALPVKSCYGQIQEAIQICEEVGVQCKLPSDSFSYSIAKPYLERDRIQPFITLHVVRHDYTKSVKRVIDLIGSLAGLILLAPLMVAIAIMIRCSSPGPVIFAQRRYGHKKRMFRMYKFRTMTQNAEHVQSTLEAENEMNGPVFKIRNDPRVTRIGRILRRTSLDELPQLWNVLVGSMSLVGPRPLPVRDVSRFADAWLMRRFSVKPGLTCLWQISGRNDTTFDRWMELDLRYIDQWSLVLDLEIIAKTFAVVLRGSGAS